MPRLAGREAAAWGRHKQEWHGCSGVYWLTRWCAADCLTQLQYGHVHPALEAYLGCCCGASRKGACMRDCILPLAAATAGTVHGAVCSWELYVRLNSQVWLCCCSGRR